MLSRTFLTLDGIPVEKRIEYISMSDEKGNCSFNLYWTVDTIEHVQCFYGNPVLRGFPSPEDAKRKGLEA